MSIINILTFFTFITVFLYIFFELLYKYSKKEYLNAHTKNSTVNRIHLLKRIAHKLNWPAGLVLPKIFNYTHIEILLHKSGKPLNLTIQNFITLHRLLGDITFLVALILITLSGLTISNIVLFSMFWLILVYSPIFYLKILISRRIDSFNQNFGTFIDMLSLAVNAGMNFEQALFFTTNKFTGIIHEEFKNVKHELSYGHSLEIALTNLSTRINSLDLRRFVTAIKQAKQLGTPMSKLLQTQSTLILTNRIQRVEELSRTASVKISIPLVFFIFPALLILYLAPAILQFTTN